MYLKIIGLLFLVLSSVTYTAIAEDEPSSSPKTSLFSKLIGGKERDPNKPLLPDEAFQLSISTEKGVIQAHWTVTPGHYIYKDKIAFKVQSPDTMKLGKLSHPKSKTKDDEFLGKMEVFEKDFTSQVQTLNYSGKATIQTTFQGCSELTGTCYTPQRKTHIINVVASDSKATDSGSAGTLISDTKTSTTTSTATVASTIGKCDALSQQQEIKGKLGEAGTLGAIVIFFLIGLGLAFTPCIYPMIPILSSIIVGQGKAVTPKKAFVLSLAYVIPMALIYALAGYFVGNSGESLQVLFQTPWVIASFAIIFVLLSLSMFGFYELQMPSAIQNKLTAISNSQEGGSILGAAIMGALSALIVGPCVTAPLMAAFAYISQVGSPLLGSLDMFAMGLGIGVPLVLIGTSAGKLLPKAGAWMDATKAFFGVLMIAMAIWMLERIVPAHVTLLLSAMLLIISAIYMGALERINNDDNGWEYLWKGFGIITLLYGSLLLVGSTTGNGTLSQPLQNFAGMQEKQGITFQKVKGLKGLKEALASAKAQNRPVILDFYADWCSYCKVMEHKTFTDKGVFDAFKNTLFLQTDITANDAIDNELLQAYDLVTPPIILFFNSQGVEQKNFRLVGNIDAPALTVHAKKFINCHGK
ncbi:MAG: protein-disulfide reductase DsbD [Thiotrichaceae bacterium]|nr:protein-disulfide reductase DsbD [Thiotrichaceae bacterium]